MAGQSRNAPAHRSTAPILIIGFDSGTTSFKTGMLEAEEVSVDPTKPYIVRYPDEQVIPLGNFPGYHRFDSCTTPTALIYDEEANLIKYGHDATNYQTSENFNSNYSVEYWKLLLRKSSNPAARQLRRSLLAKAKRLGISPEQFIEDFFGAVGGFLLGSNRSPLLSHHGGKRGLERFKYVDVVIALPPGWPRDEHKTFTSSAIQGLGQDHRLRVFTVSETECVLRYWTQGKRARVEVFTSSPASHDLSANVSQ
jgi:hypothetical protein